MSLTPLRRPEILAPAGTLESFEAAIAAGADAIYLGLSEGFHARSRSTAFSASELPRLVHRAHLAAAKVYVTVNTLVFERELHELESLLRSIAESGADAVIVQDPATALLARELCPGLRVHASTQMTVSSLEGIAFAETLGISRVVLPRELHLREIAEVAGSSSMECEVFVHGALCMAWSGQCLTSEVFSERSANRGQCSQACRMPYQAIVDGQLKPLADQRYLLSPEDLAAYEVLPDLMAAGVQGLKIEGRYKGPAYVKTAVESYRKLRDAALRGTAASEEDQLRTDFDKTRLTFSRGSSVGFLRGDNHQTLVHGLTPKHRGLLLGEVLEVGARSVRLRFAGEERTREFLRPGVGVKFELRGRTDAEHNPEGSPGGPVFAVAFSSPQDLELTFGVPGPELSFVRAGDEARLTGDPEIKRETERLLRQAVEGRIEVDLRVAGRAGDALTVTATCSWFGHTELAQESSSTLLAPARSGPGLQTEILKEKLGSFGGTPFRLAKLTLEELDSGLFLPLSELKELRRRITLTLTSQLEQRRSQREVKQVPAAADLRSRLLARVEPAPGPPELIPLCRTQEQLEVAISCGFPEVELDFMEMVGLSRAVTRARSAGLRVTLATVRVQKPGEEAYDRRIENQAPDGILVRHLGALMHFAKERATRRESAPALHGDFSLNVTNSISACHFLGLGLETVTASHDLNRDQLLDLIASTPRGRVGVTLHHHIPTFHNSHCVYAHLLSNGSDYRTCGRPCDRHRIKLRDYAGHEHPMLVDVSCRNTMFQATAQSAAPLLPELLKGGVRRFRVELVWEEPAEAERTLTAYQNLLAQKITPTEAMSLAGVSENYGVVPLRTRK